MRPISHTCIPTTERYLKWAEPSLLHAGAAVVGEQRPRGRGPGHLEKDGLQSRGAVRGPATCSDCTPRSSPRGFFRLFSPFKGSNSVSKSCLATSLLPHPIAQQPFRNAATEALGEEPVPDPWGAAVRRPRLSRPPTIRFLQSCPGLGLHLAGTGGRLICNR